ncbi:MAG TPA: PVC-type heme-binding CxxCH protein [Methylomirabilota bacterium]|nr:PVC-type heme-binding CxxCH protein [Methylomirabilota bacterium]
MLKVLHILAAALSLSVPVVAQSAFQTPNTQEETSPFISSAEALKGWKLPPGFKISLFASEPAIQQPIALCWDARGRLWVAENYTYAEVPKNFDASLRDRIVILEDTNEDGSFDKRTVFWDKGVKLTSVAVGFGGVYVLCAPKLMFIADKNGDDVPDGEPEVLLDGFDEGAVRHNVVNGLKFGPDGWLYGRHGIQATSAVGAPGADDDDRTNINCSVWRWHPVTRQFDVVFRGTTNPWGHDWDEHGQLFLINTVIGHLWHVVPGAHTKRMYGEHDNPHLYELIDQTADHVHWDTRERWDDIRKGVTASTLELGGGHAHSGLMVYLGGNWPGEYRNNLFTLNFHGRRLNQDTIERHGATYISRHRPDVASTSDVWFRGIDLTYGPDGGVYVLDWSDLGECHENDGVHRTSGRIYKITYGDPKKVGPLDLRKLSTAELVKLQLHENEWFARMAALILQERAVAGQNMAEAHQALLKIYDTDASVPRKLRALWRLYVTGGANEQFLLKQVAHSNEHIRAWAVQLLIDKGPLSPALAASVSQLVSKEQSGLVLAALTSVLRKEPHFQQSHWDIAKAVGSPAFANDRVLPLLLWHAIEHAVARQPDQAAALIQSIQMPKVRRFIARRVTSDMEKTPAPVNALVDLLPRISPSMQLDVLTGMNDAMRGWRKAQAPQSWARVAGELSSSATADSSKLLRELGVLFGDGRAADELKKIVADDDFDIKNRREALEALVQSRAEGLLPIIQPLLAEREIGPDAVRALGALGAPEAPEILVKQFKSLRSPNARLEAVNALSARPKTALMMLEAVGKGDIQKQQITAFQLQQLRILNDPAIDAAIAKLWPELPARTADKREQVAKYKTALTPEKIGKANAAHGREIYTVSCGACHKLYGQGGEVGPDLTGSDRKNLAYLIDNVVDPSGLVPENFRASTVTLKDGRTINGVVGVTTDRTMVLQTATEKMTLDRTDIQSVEQSALSLMPEGLFDALEEKDLLDLVAYLVSEEPPQK